MNSSPVTNFRIEVTPKGGFITGSADGKGFDFGRLEFGLTAAIAAVLNGPNPEYDAENKIFISSARLRVPSAKPLALSTDRKVMAFIDQGDENGQ